jgi:hypothetical protein
MLTAAEVHERVRPVIARLDLLTDEELAALKMGMQCQYTRSLPYAEGSAKAAMNGRAMDAITAVLTIQRRRTEGSDA